MDHDNIPTPGTRVTYSRFSETCYYKNRRPVEQWSGSVIRSYEDEFGDFVVEVERDGGGVETFWNNSWNHPSPYESVEVHS